MPDYSEAIGLIGACVYIFGYVLLQFDAINGNSRLYAGINLVAASLVLFSLVFCFHAGSVVTQSFFFAASLIGLLRKRPSLPPFPEPALDRLCARTAPRPGWPNHHGRGAGRTGPHALRLTGWAPGKPPA